MLAQYGLDYDRFSEGKQLIIHCAITVLGQPEPDSNRTEHGAMSSDWLPQMLGP